MTSSIASKPSIKASSSEISSSFLVDESKDARFGSSGERCGSL